MILTKPACRLVLALGCALTTTALAGGVAKKPHNEQGRAVHSEQGRGLGSLPKFTPHNEQGRRANPATGHSEQGRA